MTWKNVLNPVPNKRSKFITRMFNVISFCNIKWIYLCREVWKDAFQHAHRAYSLFDAIMGAFYFSILLICTV
jgi:hypothetical protein